MVQNSNFVDALNLYASKKSAETWNAMLEYIYQTEFLTPCQIEGEIVDTDINGGVITNEDAVCTFYIEQFEDGKFLVPVFTDINLFKDFYLHDISVSPVTVNIYDIIEYTKNTKTDDGFVIDGFVINPNRECVSVLKTKSNNQYLCLGGMLTTQNYINILILTIISLSVLGIFAWLYLTHPF